MYITEFIVFQRRIFIYNDDVRIAFIVNAYPPHVGGVELHVQSLARELHNIGVETAVFTLAELNDRQIDNGVPIFRYRNCMNVEDVFSLPTPSSILSLVRQIRACQPDVLSVHTRFFPLTWIGIYLGKILGIPTILTEHGSNFVASDSRIIASVSKLVDFTLGRYSFRRASQVLSVSESSASFVQKISGVHARIFYNAITPPNLSLPPHAPTDLVFVGRLVEGKGWKDFLYVADALHSENPKITATVIGSGLDMDAVQADAPPWVRLTGQLSHQETLATIAGATLVNPTVLSEGFQTTVVEAVAHGGRVVGYPEPASHVLSKMGAPVNIVTRGNRNALLDATRSTLLAPPDPMRSDKILDWTWPVRAQEYKMICESLI